MGILQRLWDALGLGEPIDEIEYEDEMEEFPADASGEQGQRLASRKSSSKGKVVGMTQWGNEPAEMLVVQPKSFEEIPQVVVALKQRKSIILNLSSLDAETAQRCVDFVAGGVFAIDGHQHRVGESVFLFTPGCIQITPQSLAQAIPAAKPAFGSSPQTLQALPKSSAPRVY